MKICIFCRKRFDRADWQCPDCGRMPPVCNGFLSFMPQEAKVDGGFNEAFFAELFMLEKDNYWFRSRNRLILWALASYFGNASNFLEVGCGTGYVLSGIRQVFPEMALYGGEIFHEGLSFASKRLPGQTFYQMDVHSIPFENEFDTVGAFDVLEHIDDDTVALEQLYQAIKPGGGLILTVPQHRILWSEVDVLAFHKRRYSRSELVSKVQDAGFSIVRVTSFVSLLFPFMLASRMLRHFMKSRFGKYDPLSEYNISPFLRKVLEAVLGWERIAIGKGVSFPAGGSLLLIARKGM